MRKATGVCGGLALMSAWALAIPTAGAATPAAPARVDANLTNFTPCALRLLARRLDAGEWLRQPPEVIGVGETAKTRVTATAADVAGGFAYQARDCDNPRYNGLLVILRWRRHGARDADGWFDGTDPAFLTYFFGSDEARVNGFVSDPT